MGSNSRTRAVVFLSVFLIIVEKSAEAKSSIPDSTFKRNENSLSQTRLFRDTFSTLFDAAGVSLGLLKYQGGAEKTAAVILGLGTVGMKALWESTLSNELDKKERTSELRKAIHGEIQTMRDEWKIQGENFYRDPIYSKLAITERLLNSMTDPRFKEDAQKQMPYTIAILREQREGISKLANDYQKLSNDMRQNKKGSEKTFLQFSKNLDSIGQSFTVASKRISELEKTLQLGQVDVSQSTGEVKASFSDVRDELAKMKQNEKEIKALSSYFFQEALRVNTETFQSSKHIMKLETELMELGKKQDKVGVFQKSHELKQAIQVEQQKRLAFDRKLDTLGSGMDLVAIGASFLGNKKLAHQISTVGHATVTIGKGIGALMGVGTAAAASGPLAPIVAIAGAILSVFGLFDSSPNIEEVILDQIRELQGQVQEVRKEMHERFDHVEKMIEEHHKHVNVRFDRVEDMLGKLHEQMHERFDRVELMLNQFYKDVFSEFTKVECDTKSILALSRRIKTQLDRIETRVDEQLRALYSQPFAMARDQALDFHLHGVSTTMSVETQKNYFTLFKNFAAEHASHSMYTGKDSGTLNDALDCIRQKQIEFCLGLFTSIMQKSYGISSYSSLPNPIIWAEGANTLLEFIYRTPELEIVENHKSGIEKVEKPAMTFLEFVKELKTNPKAVLKLFQDYRAAVDTIRATMFNLWVAVVEAGSEKKLQDQIKETVLFVKPAAFLEKAEAQLVATESAKQAMKSHVLTTETARQKLNDLQNDGYQKLSQEVSGLAQEAIQKSEVGYDYIEPCSSYMLHVTGKCSYLRPCTDHWPAQHASGRLSRVIERTFVDLAEITLRGKGQQSCQGTADAVALGNLVIDKILRTSDSVQTLNNQLYQARLHSDSSSESARMINDNHVILLAVKAEAFKQLTQKAKEIYDKVLHDIDHVGEFLKHHVNATYRKSIHDRLSIDAVTEAEELYKNLDSLDAAYVMILAYLELAFHYEFHTSTEFKSQIQRLMAAADIKNRIQDYNGTAPKGHLYFVLKDELVPAIEKLESLVLEKVAEAQAQKMAKTLRAGYPLVEDVLLDLSIFKSLFFSQPSFASKKEEMREEL